MKLAQLKEKFKNRYVTRIVAGILTVAVLGSSTTAYNVYASKAQQPVKSDQEQKFVPAESLLENNRKESDQTTEKEETVYIIADSAGKAETTIVSEWLKNPGGEETIQDMSDLSDIENVKGDEQFKKDGNKLSWDADGKDIYYQGTTKKEAPVTTKLTYYLDGKEIEPEKLAGKSGKVKIRFDYTNNEKRGDVYVPFAAVSGMVLNDSFTNVEVENGKVISNGDANIAVGVALPGLKESLKIEESDFSEDISIPDYVEVTADVKNFSLDMTMTVIVSASKLSEFGDFDWSNLDEKIEDLADATDQLKDGSKELYRGLDTLNQKMGEFSGGVDTLQSGITAYTDGAGKLAEGIETLRGQTGVLINGVSDLTASVGTLNAGMKILDQTLNKEMDEKAKASVRASAAAQAESAVEAQFADDSNALGYNQIKSQASQKFYELAASDTAKQTAAELAKQAATAGIQSQKAQISATARAQAEAGIQSQKAQIAASAKEQALGSVRGQLDQIAASAREQAESAASGAVSDDMKQQLRSAFMAAGYAQAAAAQNITVEEAMSNSGIQAQVAQAAEAQLQTVLGTIKTAAGSVADQTARSVAEQVTGGAAEQTAGAVAEQVAGSVAEQTAGSVAEQVAGSVAQQAAPVIVEGIAQQAKEAVGTTVADSVKQGAKTAASQAAGQAAVAGAETAKKQIAESIEKKDAKTGYSLVSGMQALDAGVNGMSGKMPQLTAGIEQLYHGSQTLASKKFELNSGTQKLANGKDQMADGVKKLTGGSKELSEGMSEFAKEGIEKLVNSYHGDVREFTDRIEAVLDAGKSYESFGGKSDDITGNVKFIIKTGEIIAEK